jgi:hypothetical protein
MHREQQAAAKRKQMMVIPDDAMVIVISDDDDNDDNSEEMDGVSHLRRIIEEKTILKYYAMLDWQVVANSFTYAGEMRRLYRSSSNESALTLISVYKFVKQCWWIDITMKKSTREKGVAKQKLD